MVIVQLSYAVGNCVVKTTGAPLEINRAEPHTLRATQRLRRLHNKPLRLSTPYKMHASGTPPSRRGQLRCFLHGQMQFC